MTCEYDNCRNTPKYYLAYGCINQHIADNKTCQTHLNLIKTLINNNKFRCSQCPQPIISGLYQLIHSQAKRICIRNLDGQTIKIINNPEYTPPPETPDTTNNTLTNTFESITTHPKWLDNLPVNNTGYITHPEDLPPNHPLKHQRSKN